MIKTKQDDENLKAFCQKKGCAKGYVNGPCGGFVDGKCEVDYTKNCVWVLVYKKLKNDENLEKFVNQYVAPM
jgi:hypothetical protein